MQRTALRIAMSADYEALGLIFHKSTHKYGQSHVTFFMLNFKIQQELGNDWPAQHVNCGQVSSCSELFAVFR